MKRIKRKKVNKVRKVKKVNKINNKRKITHFAYCGKITDIIVNPMPKIKKMLNIKIFLYLIRQLKILV